MGTHKIYSGIQGIRDNISGSLYGDCHELLALQGVSENLGRVAVSKTNMADREELNFEEIHFSPIPSQTNIYGLTKIESREEGNKIFLASLSGRVVCLEYLSNSLVPTSREVPFTYIPGLF